jgi:hypothetical protein
MKTTAGAYSNEVFGTYTGAMINPCTVDAVNTKPGKLSIATA